jgi:aryl sulfotransferase
MNHRHAMPVRSRDYQGHLLDSSRWGRFHPRHDDVVIATAYKAGTTWMQAIVGNLIFQGQDIPGAILEMSPWVDMRVVPLDDMVDLIEGQTHRRFVKSHLALDGLRFFPEVKYIHISRDLRDVFISLWNHHRNYSDEALQAFRDVDDTVGWRFPDCPETPGDFWRDWISRGTSSWEHDGYPYWSSLHHLASWWDYRQLPNILFVHYNDLLRDIEGEMRRVAQFLDIDVPEAAWPELTHAVSIDTLRDNAATFMGSHGKSFKGGGKTFLYKGTNGRWRHVLDDDDMATYRAAVDRVLDPEAAAWMENGRVAINP